MAGWPTASERRELGAYPAQAGPEDVKGFFELECQQAPTRNLRWAKRRVPWVALIVTVRPRRN